MTVALRVGSYAAAQSVRRFKPATLIQALATLSYSTVSPR